MTEKKDKWKEKGTSLRHHCITCRQSHIFRRKQMVDKVWLGRGS